MPNFEDIPPDIVQIIKARIQQYLDDQEKAHLSGKKSPRKILSISNIRPARYARFRSSCSNRSLADASFFDVKHASANSRTYK
jgi:hypothetical protein